MNIDQLFAAIPPSSRIIREGDKTTVVLYVKTVSELNQRECWQARLRRKKAQQSAARPVFLAAFNLTRPKPPLAITFTRVSVMRLDPDAIGCAMKHLQDCLCSVLGIDDGDDRLTFVYQQRRASSRREARVEVEVRKLDVTKGTV